MSSSSKHLLFKKRLKQLGFIFGNGRIHKDTKKVYLVLTRSSQSVTDLENMYLIIKQLKSFLHFSRLIIGIRPRFGHIISNYEFDPNFDGNSCLKTYWFWTILNCSLFFKAPCFDVFTFERNDWNEWRMLITKIPLTFLLWRLVTIFQILENKITLKWKTDINEMKIEKKKMSEFSVGLAGEGYDNFQSLPLVLAIF